MTFMQKKYIVIVFLLSFFILYPCYAAPYGIKIQNLQLGQSKNECIKNLIDKKLVYEEHFFLGGTNNTSISFSKKILFDTIDRERILGNIEFIDSQAIRISFYDEGLTVLFNAKSQRKGFLKALEKNFKIKFSELEQTPYGVGYTYFDKKNKFYFYAITSIDPNNFEILKQLYKNEKIITLILENADQSEFKF